MRSILLTKKAIIFVSFLLTIQLFITNQSVVLANKDENKPVLITEIVTGDSVHLAWPLTLCDIDCNTLHLIRFQRWELYQRAETESDFGVVFNTSELSETSTIISDLESNTKYYYFVKLIWNNTNYEEYYEDYKEHFVSQVIFIETLNPGETKVFFENTLYNSTETETNPNTSPDMMVYFIPLVLSLAIFIRRKVQQR